MQSSLRLNAKLLPVIAGLAFVMQVIDPSRAWIILFVAVGGTWLVCRWWVHGLARSLMLEREMRFGWAQVGDRLEERFTLTNEFLWPATWVAVQDHSNLPDHSAAVATGVDGRSTSQWKIQSRCTRRGVYTLGGTTLETGDPLGIYSLRLEDPACSTLAVMPPVVTLPEFRVASSGWAGDGRRNARSLEETINASHTREMVPGDPMRFIHWKSSARQNKFFVRQFEGTPAGEWWVLLDLHRGSQVGAGWDSTEEHGVLVAAALAARGLDEEHPVGLAINGREPAWIVPRRNENQLRSLLKALAVAAPADMGIRDYIQRAGQTLGSRSSLLVITANPDPAWTESLLPLMWRGVMPTAFILDPGSYGGAANTNAIEAALSSMGAGCHIIPRQLLDTREARPGSAGEWEWRVLGTGKAVAVRSPAADWRRLG